jgi:hypothetical protein
VGDKSWAKKGAQNSLLCYSICFPAVLLQLFGVSYKSCNPRISVEALTRPGSGAKKEIDCEE